MASAQHTLVRRAVEEIWNTAQLDIADELFAPTYVNHGGLITDLVLGPEAIKTSVILYRLAFPELHITIDDVASAGQDTVVHWSARNCPPSERASTASMCAIGIAGVTRTHEANGQIQESWTDWDRDAALRHLGRSTEVVD